MTSTRRAPAMPADVIADELDRFADNPDDRAAFIGAARSAWSMAYRHPVKAANGRRHMQNLAADLAGRIADVVATAELTVPLVVTELARLEHRLADANGRTIGATAGLRAAGQCQRCGRPLSDPVSVRRGVGPDCWASGYRPDDVDDLDLADLEAG